MSKRPLLRSLFLAANHIPAAPAAPATPAAPTRSCCSKSNTGLLFSPACGSKLRVLLLLLQQLRQGSCRAACSPAVAAAAAAATAAATAAVAASNAPRGRGARGRAAGRRRQRCQPRADHCACGSRRDWGRQSREAHSRADATVHVASRGQGLLVRRFGWRDEAGAGGARGQEGCVGAGMEAVGNKGDLAGTSTCGEDAARHVVSRALAVSR